MLSVLKMNSIKRRAVSALAIGSLASLGCGQTAESAGVTWQQVVGPRVESSPSEQDAVVGIINHGAYATGFLVAPSLVMTARHVTFEEAKDGPWYVNCKSSAPVTQASDPSRFSILVGAHTPFADAKVLRAKRVFAGPDLDLCKDDIALMQLQDPISDIVPLQLRLDAGAIEGEQGTLVGWGSNNDQPQIKFGTQRYQVSLPILSVGRDYQSPDTGDTVGVAPSTFLAGNGACFGDSGGPFISQETGSVVGVMSTIYLADPSTDLGKVPKFEECLDALSVFQTLSFQRDWLRAAFAEAGEAPWLEGLGRPAPVGASCQVDPECISGVCAVAGDTRFCSESCEQKSCPSDMLCAGPSGSHLCVPQRAKAGSAASASCAVTPLRTSQPAWVAVCFCALLIALWRRRRFRHHCAF